MSDADFIDQINEKKTTLGVTQLQLASACCLDQGHLSKVLSKKLKLAKKTEVALRRWLTETENGVEGVRGDDIVIRELVERLTHAPGKRRMQIMQLLKIVDGLAG